MQTNEHRIIIMIIIIIMFIFVNMKCNNPYKPQFHTNATSTVARNFKR